MPSSTRSSRRSGARCRRREAAGVELHLETSLGPERFAELLAQLAHPAGQGQLRLGQQRVARLRPRARSSRRTGAGRQRPHQGPRARAAAPSRSGPATRTSGPLRVPRAARYAATSSCRWRGDARRRGRAGRRTTGLSCSSADLAAAVGEGAREGPGRRPRRHRAAPPAQPARRCWGRRRDPGLPRARALQTLTDTLEVEAGADVEEKYGVTVFADLDAALGERPDAVFVCNPSSLHVSVALKAARAGCHLFVEKPLSHTPTGSTS